MKEDRNRIKETKVSGASVKTRDSLPRVPWKKVHNNRKPHPAVPMNQVMGRKVANQVEDEKKTKRRKTVMLSGNVWRIWHMGLTC